MGNDLITQNEQVDVVIRQLTGFLRSGFLPPHIDSPQKAFAIWQMGRELGIPPMQSFRSINVIKGKPTLSAELMLGLIYQRIPGSKVTFKTPPERQHLECEVTMQRPGGDAQTFSFSMEDAKRAGLGGANWQKYPAAMMRARVVSAGARAVFPDAIMGCYTPEELDEPEPVKEPKKVSSRPKPPAKEEHIEAEVHEPEPVSERKGKPATKNQIGFLKSIQRENHFPNDYFRESIRNIIGITLPNTKETGELCFDVLSSKQASDVIAELIKERGQELKPLTKEEMLPFEEGP